MLGLRPDRADLIGIAAQVMHFIADEGRISRIQVPGIGLKDGVLLQLAAAVHLERSGDPLQQPQA